MTAKVKGPALGGDAKQGAAGVRHEEKEQEKVEGAVEEPPSAATHDVDAHEVDEVEPVVLHDEPEQLEELEHQHHDDDEPADEGGASTTTRDTTVHTSTDVASDARIEPEEPEVPDSPSPIKHEEREEEEEDLADLVAMLERRRSAPEDVAIVVAGEIPDEE